MTDMTEIEKLVDNCERAACAHYNARLSERIRTTGPALVEARAALLAAIRGAVGQEFVVTDNKGNQLRLRPGDTYSFTYEMNVLAPQPGRAQEGE